MCLYGRYLCGGWDVTLQCAALKKGMANNFKIVSLNCRGLRDKGKKKDVFNYLRQLKHNIYCLQDTHLTVNDINDVRNVWGYDCYVAGKRTDARGVAVLVNNNFEYKLIEEILDPDGNYIILKLEIEKQFTITLVNIYGPNGDNPDFYHKIEQEVSDIESDHVIMSADWNLVQDYDLDCYNYKLQNNPNARKAVLGLKNRLNLLDPWRSYNANLRRYTWSRKNPVKKARLDFFLISQEMMTYIEKVDILPGYLTDHAMTFIEFRLTNFTRGRGFWRFNNSLLKDQLYIGKVKESIRQTIEEYAIPVYSRDAIKDLDPSDLHFIIDDQLFFEMLLLKIRGMSIPYCAMKKRKEEENKNTLERQIKLFQEIADQYPEQNRFLTELIEDLKVQMEEFRKKYMAGLLVRTRANWIEAGEKPSKYFCALEKRNYVNKNITKLTSADGTNILDQKAILQEVKSFYVALYASRDDSLVDTNLDETLENVQAPKLSIEDKDMLDEELTIEEVADALKKMKNNKSPGPDGFTVEFFKFFWSNLRHFMFRSFKAGIRSNDLSVTQKQGVISILPKGDKPRENLKNWRPISLLNVSYKILSGCIAARIRKVLHTIIHEDQRGFMKDRFIGENTRLLYDVMQYTDQNKIPGQLLLIDFEKAFDSVSWKFISKSLVFFNFGPGIINLIKLLYKDAKLCVMQHGIFSEFFTIGRGCRQGDPSSPYLFLLCAEILGILIRSNQDITGIKIGVKEYKLFQYADDTGILLDGTEKSLRCTLHLLDQYAKYSGLKPNLEKTKCVWLGSKKSSLEVLCPEHNLCWTRDPFVVLGIKFSTNLQKILDLNFEDKLLEIEKLVKIWSRRPLSVPGRITVVKTIMLSKLTHLLTSLPRPGRAYLKKLEKILFKYIWNGKIDRISRCQLVQDYGLGGLRMIDLDAFATSLKLSWIQKMLTSNTVWSELCNTIVQGQLDMIFTMGDAYVKKKLNNLKNVFWSEVFETLTVFRALFDHDRGELLYHSLWYNSKILIDNQVVFYRQWYNKGIHTIGDLLNKDGLMMSYEEFCNRYFRPMITTFAGLRNAILETYPWLKDTSHCVQYPHCPKYLYTILCNKKFGIKIYDLLVKSKLKDKKHEKYKEKWKTELNLVNKDEKWWEKINYAVKSPLEVKLRWFQYRIIHRILGTNAFLCKIGIVDSPLCTFCKESPETIVHLFVNCRVVGQLLQDTVIWLNGTLHIPVIFSQSDIILGFPTGHYKSLNLLVILFKLYIYKQRVRNCIPDLGGFQSEVKTYYLLEKYIYKSNLQSKDFRTRWEPFIAFYEPD